MHSIKINGHVDEQHRLYLDVPNSVPPGPVTVWVFPSSPEDDAGDAWAAGVATEWADELNDPREDIYTLTDGEPVREP